MELSKEEVEILLAALDLFQLYGNDYAVKLNEQGFIAGAAKLAQRVDAAPALAERLQDEKMGRLLFA